MDWDGDTDEEDDTFEAPDITEVRDLSKIQDLTLDDCMDLGHELGILGEQRISSHKDVQLVLLIHFLKSIGGMDSRGREPFQVLKKIQSQNREKSSRLASLFTDLKTKLSHGDWADLVKDLVETVQGFHFPESFDEHIHRLNHDESCRIMVTGELCSGKTTLINSLLGMKILPSSELSNTITMCEIRYAETRSARAIPWQPSNTQIILATVLIVDEENMADEDPRYEIIQTFTIIKEEDCRKVTQLRLQLNKRDAERPFKFNANPHHEHNEALGELGTLANEAISVWNAAGGRTSNKTVAVKVVTKGDLFVKTLGQYVQAKQADTDDLGLYKIVEVYIKNPLLEGGLTIVDSPGIGDNQALNEMVIQYTSEAFAFIYVVNCAMKGGVQEDRLKMLLRKVHSRRMLNKQSMFSTKSAIFVCNKWDEVASGNRDRVFKYIMRGLEQCWPGVTSEQIVPFCASHALKVYDEGLLTPEFKDLLQKFERLIPHGLENKLYHSVSWLEGILMQVDEFLLRCLGNLDDTVMKIQKRFREAKARMQKLEELSEENFKDLNKFVNAKVDEAVENLSVYLQKAEILEQIAIWKDSEVPTSVMKDWERQKILICKQLEIKVKAFVDCWAKDTKFLEKVNPEVNDRFIRWFDQPQVMEELGEIRDIVINREALEIRGIAMAGFTNREDDMLLDKVQKALGTLWQEKRALCLVALPVAVPVALVAALPLVVAIGVDQMLTMMKQQFNMPKLEAYKNDRLGVLNEITKEIVPEYCKSKQFREYVSKLLEDSFTLVRELRQVIPKQLNQERKNMDKIETDHRDRNHERRRYEPFRQICVYFRRYIQHYAVMNLRINQRDVKSIAYSDTTLQNHPQVTKGWFSDVMKIKVDRTTSNSDYYMRSQLAVLEVAHIQDYLTEESVWRSHSCVHLPTLVYVSMHNDRVHHVLTHLGSTSLRTYLTSQSQMEADQVDVFDTKTQAGVDKLKARVGEVRPIAEEIVKGLKYLHEYNLVCADLTSDTVTIDQHKNVKLTNISRPKQIHLQLDEISRLDFPDNLNRLRYLPYEMWIKPAIPRQKSIRNPHKLNSKVVKEMDEHPSYSKQCDIYSFGLLVWEMTSSQIAFQKLIDLEDVADFRKFVEEILAVEKRPEIPDLNTCPDEIVHWYKIIQDSWRHLPTTRPDVKTVIKMMRKTFNHDDFMDFKPSHFSYDN